MNELLNKLEQKVKGILEERALYLGERDLLALKVIELQDEMHMLKAQIEFMESKHAQNDQDTALTTMVVEEMLNLIEEKSANPGA